MNITLDQTATLSPTNILPSGAVCVPTYESDDETVITVEDNVVTAVAEGTAIITGTDGDTGVTATLEFTVTEPVPVLESFEITATIDEE